MDRFQADGEHPPDVVDEAEGASGREAGCHGYSLFSSRSSERDFGSSLASLAEASSGSPSPDSFSGSPALPSASSASSTWGSSAPRS